MAAAALRHEELLPAALVAFELRVVRLRVEPRRRIALGLPARAVARQQALARARLLLLRSALFFAVTALGTPPPGVALPPAAQIERALPLLVRLTHRVQGPVHGVDRPVLLALLEGLQPL